MKIMAKLTSLVLALLLLLGGLAALLWGLPGKPITIQKAPLFSPQEPRIPTFTHASSDFAITIVKPDIPVKKESVIYGAIVPHHLLAISIITETLARVADHKKTVSHVVLLAPNHFDKGIHKVITSDGDWKTAYGVVQGNQRFVKSLVAQNLALLDYDAISDDHGVFNIMPFIKRFFPEALVTPLMVREPLDDLEAQALATFLAAKLPRDALILVSADFSHYLPSSVANVHDAASLAALFNLDISFLSRMDVDTPSSLRVLMHYAIAKGGERFVLTGHANSVDFVGGGGTHDTTSYISGYFTKGAAQKTSELTLFAVGDIMLDRNVLALMQKMNDMNYPFLGSELVFKGMDVRLANLEGPITEFGSVSIKDSSMRFTFSPQVVQPLAKRLDILSLANNHTQDFGAAGLGQTKTLLHKAGIAFFGDYHNNPLHLSHIIEKNGIRIGLIGYHGLVAGGVQPVVDEIKQVKAKTDFVIVVPHWGPEYQKLPSPRQKSQAHQFIDAGADLILGAHPHVIQPLEIYNGKVIFYSLGNFIFDQYFSKETMEGLGVALHVKKLYTSIQVEYSLFPFALGRSQPTLASVQRRGELLLELSTNSVADQTIRQGIANGQFTLTY